MKNETSENNMTEAKKIRKPYVKPTTEVMHLTEEDICLVSVSQQQPPMDNYSGKQDDDDENQGNTLWKSQHSVWDN